MKNHWLEEHNEMPNLIKSWLIKESHSKESHSMEWTRDGEVILPERVVKTTFPARIEQVRDLSGTWIPGRQNWNAIKIKTDLIASVINDDPITPILTEMYDIGQFDTVKRFDCIIRKYQGAVKTGELNLENCLCSSFALGNLNFSNSESLAVELTLNYDLVQTSP